MAADPENSTDEKEKRAKHRSPAYPFIPLSAAIDRAKSMHDATKGHPARLASLAKPWGFQAVTSVVSQMVSALRQFGLLEVQDGEGNDRIVKLTPMATKIVLDKREPDRRNAIQEAALKPKLYADLWAKWSTDIPADEIAESYLMVDLKYNPAYVKQVLDAYKATIAFAGLGKSATLSIASDDKQSDLDAEQDDMESATESAKSDEQKPVRLPASPIQPMRGEEEILRAKLAGGRSVRVLMLGPAPTSSEIDRLIKHLELLKETLEPDAQAVQSDDKQ